MDILETKNLSLKLNGKNILDRLNIDFWEGHVHAVVGPNGAGKSTLAYTIMGLEGYRNIDGDIFFDGVSIKNLGVAERAKIGITLGWQEPARYEGLTVKQFINASAKEKKNGFSERANVLIDETGKIELVHMYKISELPDINKILTFIRNID